jgi:hypothetical protein
MMLAEQLFRTGHIVFFPRSEKKLQRLALSVYGYMQLATESAARAAERFVAGLFLGEPAAC